MTIEFVPIEATHLLDLLEQFERILVGDAASDPAVRRLVPDAYRDDEEAAREFRRLTEGDLLARRRSELGIVRDGLRAAFDGRDAETVVVELDAAGVQAWLRTLAALRLVIAERLGVVDDTPPNPADARTDVYEWLGYRLDRLVASLG
ncbi:DUF2017 family protein [Microbacterium dauci]|uniref:DUF2017 family protein n=1 Tax=Microbacterium dauci TaxID=3048008 RepID=A0ABT6ZDF4_9MICO|nr:DUF2017 family protein [Microbacterium sp. LX3-4]MDJ1113672.1 DUF2017 family protein [Microbacterium sp. LX3-4]